MNEQKRQRALNAFSAMSHLPDDYVTAAESALYEAEAGLYRPEKTKGPLRRFMSSGWGVALISGIAALTAVALIIRAGQDPGTVTPPPRVNPPVGGTLTDNTDMEDMTDMTEVESDEAEMANFTLSTDQKTYSEGITSFVVTLTGKNPGEDISLPGEWHLYRVTAEGTEPVIGMYYTDEAVDGIAPDENTCATLSKTIFINPHNSDQGLTAGKYLLSAVLNEGTVDCAFEVVAADIGTDSEDTAVDSEDMEYDHYAESGAVDFILSTDKETYSEGASSFVVTLTGKNPGEDISLPGEWHLYRVTAEGTEPVIGMYYTDEAVDGIAPDENTCATLSKRIFINPHNSDGGLAAGKYVIRAVTDEGYAECGFAVIEATVEAGSEEGAPGMDEIARFYIGTPEDTVPALFPIPDDVFYIDGARFTEP